MVISMDDKIIKCEDCKYARTVLILDREFIACGKESQMPVKKVEGGVCEDAERRTNEQDD